ncbi:MAG: phasin family protein [Rhodospirillaceae bacterium]|nr:MAG: phasin family protein [Rhodospirillaceae bacterium]
MTPAYDQFAKIGEDTIATIVKTNAAVVKGFEQLSRYFSELASTSLEDAVATGKKLTGAKSLTEFVEIQTKLAQSSFASLTQESKKASDLTMSIVKEVSEPFTERFKSGLTIVTKSPTKTAKAA